MRHFQQGICNLSKREHFLVRLGPGLLDRIRRWADDDFRSVNGQIEYLLTEALRRTGRLQKDAANGLYGAHPATSALTVTKTTPAAAAGQPSDSQPSGPDTDAAVSHAPESAAAAQAPPAALPDCVRDAPHAADEEFGGRWSSAGGPACDSP